MEWTADTDGTETTPAAWTATDATGTEWRIEDTTQTDDGEEDADPAARFLVGTCPGDGPDLEEVGLAATLAEAMQVAADAIAAAEAEAK